jgi:hypothetical protein
MGDTRRYVEFLNTNGENMVIRKVADVIGYELHGCC